MTGKLHGVAARRRGFGCHHSMNRCGHSAGPRRLWSLNPRRWALAVMVLHVGCSVAPLTAGWSGGHQWRAAARPCLTPAERVVHHVHVHEVDGSVGRSSLTGKAELGE